MSGTRGTTVHVVSECWGAEPALETAYQDPMAATRHALACARLAAASLRVQALAAGDRATAARLGRALRAARARNRPYGVRLAAVSAVLPDDRRFSVREIPVRRTLPDDLRAAERLADQCDDSSATR